MKQGGLFKYYLFSLEECCIKWHDGGNIEDGGQDDTVPALPECAIMSDNAALRALLNKSEY